MNISVYGNIMTGFDVVILTVTFMQRTQSTGPMDCCYVLGKLEPSLKVIKYPCITELLRAQAVTLHTAMHKSLSRISTLEADLVFQGSLQSVESCGGTFLQQSNQLDEYSFIPLQFLFVAI